MFLDDGLDNSRNLLSEIGTVLSGSHSTNDSEDIKSALIELLKLTRSANRDIVGQKLKQLIPSVLALLKHKEVIFVSMYLTDLWKYSDTLKIDEREIWLE